MKAREALVYCVEDYVDSSDGTPWALLAQCFAASLTCHAIRSEVSRLCISRKNEALTERVRTLAADARFVTIAWREHAATERCSQPTRTPAGANDTTWIESLTLRPAESWSLKVATFSYHCAVPSCSEFTKAHQLCQLPCNSSLIFNPRKRRELWRFLTYSLVHDGFLHLGSNVLLQIAFAFPLEVVHSWWPVMLVYVGGLLCGPLAQSLLNPDAYIAGSSSGVYSLQTAHLAHILTNIRDMELVGLRISMLLLVYLNDLYSIVRGPQNHHGQVLSYAGHYGGALAGLVIGLPVLNSARHRRPCF
ncbi:protein rhomboid [Dermacentor silvarum]|uniref:protein rhomboid n=1 Tax=Dermacentor silvarum TaxID=543639 RepID=UPI0021018D0B|nr:protein rhomboid [Dermacentor silvarum]